MANRKYTKEDLISEFWRYYEENGVYPKKSDMKHKNGFPSNDSYVYNFGSWNNFLNHVGVLGESRWYKCDEDVLRNYYPCKSEEFIKENLMIKRGWSQIKKKASSMGIKRRFRSDKFSVEFMVSELKRYVEENGKSPTHDEFSKNKDYISTKSIKKEFGSWNNFLMFCDINIKSTRVHSKSDVDNFILSFYNENLTPPTASQMPFSRTLLNNYYESIKDACISLGIPICDSGFGNVFTDDFGNVSLSSSEYLISNFLINNKIVFKKDFYYNNIFNVQNCQKTMDWLICKDDVDYVVEYFGMYRKNSNNLIHKKYMQSIEEKLGILNQNNYIDKSILIYPKDLKDKSLEDIFSEIL